MVTLAALDLASTTPNWPDPTLAMRSAADTQVWMREHRFHRRVMSEILNAWEQLLVWDLLRQSEDDYKIMIRHDEMERTPLPPSIRKVA
jgi:hypothetical protein